ncbi:MAG: dihydrodipicolinate reductase [Gammaproteobacteria bacterium]
MSYDVIQISTGKVGVHALRAILRHPGLRLAGLWAHGADKHGRDAASLAGLPECGVRVSGDFDALLAQPADCALYMAQVWGREEAALTDIERLLRSGKNVIVPWLTYLHWAAFGRRYNPRAVERMEAACTAAGRSLLMTGCDPGFCTDTIPLVVTGACGEVEQVRFQEVLDYGGWHSELLFMPEFLGFGQPMDGPTPGFVTQAALEECWGCTLALIASGLGAELERMEQFEARHPAPRRIEHSHGVIEPGTVAGRHFGLKGIVAGRPLVLFEHITYVGEAPPGWPALPGGAGGYRCIVDGFPGIEVSFAVRGANGDPVSGAEAVTATRCVNLVPAVCDAVPGIVDLFDLRLRDLTWRRPIRTPRPS